MRKHFTFLSLVVHLYFVVGLLSMYQLIKVVAQLYVKWDDTLVDSLLSFSLVSFITIFIFIVYWRDTKILNN